MYTIPSFPTTCLCIDLKSYYASVECVSRGLDPLTANLLVADESRTDKTICLAVSPSLKALGVPARPRLFQARQAIRLGVCRYLLKPSDLEELKDAFRQMVSRLDAMPGLREEVPEDESVREAGNHLVKAALAYMKEHCTEQHLSLGDVADHVYVSQWHLSKLLNRETDQSFFDLLGGMRIARAKELLSDPVLRIHEVAEETGFSDVAHFSRSFKKITGCTPGEYRNRQA